MGENNMPKFLILGAGRQGITCADFLLRYFDNTEIMFYDIQKDLYFGSQLDKEFESRIDFKYIDADDINIDLIKDYNCIISCLPYFYNVKITKLAIETGKHFCDLGGNKGTVKEQITLSKEAEEKSVTIVPDCGIAPGTVSVLAEYWNNDDSWTKHTINMYCGGLPQNPEGVLKYCQFFSIHGLLNEYLDDCEILRNGKIKYLEGLSELEDTDFIISDKPDETLEAFNTSGGSSLGPEIYQNHNTIKNYQYKTLRYKGHCNIFKGMRELGLFKKAHCKGIEEEIYHATTSILDAVMPKTKEDVLKLVVEVIGDTKVGVINIEDRYDGKYTAMERTTGFSLAIIAAFITGLYEEKSSPGVYVPFQILSPKLLCDELTKSGIDISVYNGEKI